MKTLRRDPVMTQRHAHLLQPQVERSDVARAEADYQRLRNAYLELAGSEAGHEVALAMLGADMDRAHASLQHLSGMRTLPFTQEPARTPPREALHRMTEESS